MSALPALRAEIDATDALTAHIRKALERISANHRAAREELREGCAAINRVNRQTMSYLRTRDDDDPYYMSPEEERQMEADAEVERLWAVLHTEVARQESVIADLQEALSEAIDCIAICRSIDSDERLRLFDKCTVALAKSYKRQP